MRGLDETHDPALASWVASANVEGTDFPIQNLPFGVFRPRAVASRSAAAWRSATSSSTWPALPLRASWKAKHGKQPKPARRTT